MPNVNFKFDADSSKVERAIKRLGTEFEKVVNTGDNIDKTLIDFGALVDKNADKVQNLKSEMQKLNAVNLQNMATQFERINAGGFNELIQGLRNVQTGVVGTENSIENLITKLGLSRNSLQQVSTSMRAALGNMGVGSAEYTATLSQLNILEQALGRIDQNVTASAANTIAANQNKVTSTQQYMSSIRVANENFKNEILSSVSMAAGEVAKLNSKIFGEAHIGMLAHLNNSQALMDKHLSDVSQYSEKVQKIINDLRESLIIDIDGIRSDESAGLITNSEARAAEEKLRRTTLLDLNSGKLDPGGLAFAEQMNADLNKLLNTFMETGEGYEKMIDKVRSMTSSGVISIETLTETITELKESVINPKSGVANLDMVGIQNDMLKNITRVENELLDKGKLDKAVKDLADFSAGTKDQAAIVQNTLNILSGKTEEEVSAILMALQKLKQNSIIGGDQYKGLSTQIGAVSAEIQKTARANQALAGGSTSATMAIQQLGFAVGDAGMVTQNWRGALLGIGNNIPFIIGNIMEMNAAAKAAGTTGLKAFGSALTGPAGILLGINAAIFALQVMPDVITLIGKASASTADQMKKLSREIKEVTYASQGEVATSVKQKAQFQALIPVLEKTTAKSKERKAVEKEMEKLLPTNIKLTDLYALSQSELKNEIAKINAELEKNVANSVKVAIANAIATEIAKMTVENMKLQQMWGENSAEAAKWKTMSMTGKGVSPWLGGTLLTDIIGNLAGGGDFDKAIKTLDKNKKLIDSLTKELTKVTAGIDFSQKTFKDDRKDPKDPDGGKKGGKGDEYTALEKLNDQWDLLISKETDADKLAFLRYQKAFAIWELTQKIVKDQQDLVKAQIAYQSSESEYAAYLQGLYDKYQDKITDQTKADQSAMKSSDELYIERRMKAIETLKELSERALLEGMSEEGQLEYDLQKELHDVEVDEFGLKEERKLQITEYFAKRRVALEKSAWEKQMSIVAGFLDAASGLFKKNTLAYKALAIASATVDTYKAANLALASAPPPFNFIEMGAVIAAGLGNVASIIDTEITGYAKGGLITSPHLGLIGEAGAEIIAPVRDFQSYSRELIQSAYGGMGGGKELSVTVKGSDLVFTLQKATKKVNRQKIGGKV